MVRFAERLQVILGDDVERRDFNVPHGRLGASRWEITVAVRDKKGHVVHMVDASPLGGNRKLVEEAIVSIFVDTGPGTKRSDEATVSSTMYVAQHEFVDVIKKYSREYNLKTAKKTRRKNPSLAGRYKYIHACPDSTHGDIQALQASEIGIELAAFRRAVGPESWRWITGHLGYDRDFPISKDWAVRYYKGKYRGVPAYFIRHSMIEYIWTLDGKLGPSDTGYEDLRD